MCMESACTIKFKPFNYKDYYANLCLSINGFNIWNILISILLYTLRRKLLKQVTKPFYPDFSMLYLH